MVATAAPAQPEPEQQVSHGGVIAAMMTITILTALLLATGAAFLTWILTRQILKAIFTGGTTFAATFTLLLEVFTSVGPLK